MLDQFADGDRHHRLTAEIKAFVEYISPADHEHEIREDVISDVRRLIMNRWRDASVYAFGSFDTKLYLPTGCACRPVRRAVC